MPALTLLGALLLSAPPSASALGSGPAGGADGTLARRGTTPTAAGPGLLTLTTPYTADHALDLGALSLTPDGSELRTAAPFGPIVVSDTRGGDLQWTVSVQAQPLADPAGHPIDPQNLGLTDLQLDLSPGSPLPGELGNLVLLDAPAADPAVMAPDAGAQGLGGTLAHVIARARHGLGTIGLHGLLTLVAPTSTQPGRYSGTITITVF